MKTNLFLILLFTFTSFTFLQGQCESPTTSDVVYCEGDPIPQLSATAEMGLEIDWYDSCGGILLASSTNEYLPTSSGSYVVVARDPISGCTSECVELTLSESPLPEIIYTGEQFCIDCTEWIWGVTIFSDAPITTNPVLPIVNNMDGSFTILDIPGDTDIEVFASNINNCSSTYIIEQAEDICWLIPNFPSLMVTNNSYCEGEPIPSFEVIPEEGLEYSWFDQCYFGTELASDTSSFTPPGPGIYAVRSTNNCGFLSECVFVTLTEIPIQIITSEIVICAGESYNGYSESGVYIETFTSSNGCDSIMSLELTVLEPISETIDTAICIGQEFLGYSTEGNYIDTLFTAIGCDSILFIDLEILDESDPACITNLNEENLDEIVIYPNPVTNEIFFRNMDEEKEIKVVDILGNEIIKARVFNAKSLDVSSLNNGVYFIIIDGNLVKRIVKE